MSSFVRSAVRSAHSTDALSAQEDYYLLTRRDGGSYIRECTYVTFYLPKA
jgi:hypothetical protein